MSDRRPQDLDGVSPHDNTSFAARRPYAPTPGPLPVAFASTDITSLISSRSFLRLAVAAPSEMYSTSTFAMTGRRVAWRSSALLLFFSQGFIHGLFFRDWIYCSAENEHTNTLVPSGLSSRSCSAGPSDPP